MSKIIAIASQKGGVGKSTTSRNLAGILAKEGVDIIPSSIELSAVEINLVSTMSRKYILKTIIDEIVEGKKDNNAKYK